MPKWEAWERRRKHIARCFLQFKRFRRVVLLHGFWSTKGMENHENPALFHSGAGFLPNFSSFLAIRKVVKIWMLFKMHFFRYFFVFCRFVFDFCRFWFPRLRVRPGQQAGGTESAFFWKAGCLCAATGSCAFASFSLYVVLLALKRVQKIVSKFCQKWA